MTEEYKLAELVLPKRELDELHRAAVRGARYAASVEWDWREKPVLRVPGASGNILQPPIHDVYEFERKLLIQTAPSAYDPPGSKKVAICWNHLIVAQAPFRPTKAS